MTLIVLIVIVLIEIGIKAYMNRRLKDIDGIGYVHQRELKESNTIYLNVMDVGE